MDFSSNSRDRLPLMDTFLQDLRFGLRTLLKFPGFSALAIVTLALGIGASTAMFSVINKVLFVRLPFKDSPRVVYVAQKQANGVANVFSLPDFLEWKRHSGLLQHMAAFGPASFTLGAGDQPERITGAKFSNDMFYVLGVVPAIGRPFTADEDRPGAGKFVLLSDTLWKMRFASSREIVGSKVDLDGLPHTVLGVMPRGFYVLANTELAWVPYQMQTEDTAASSRTVHLVFGLARLEPKQSVQQEQAQLDSVAARLHREDPQGDAGFGVALQRYQDALTAGVKPALWLLMGCVGFVLLIACSNVATSCWSARADAGWRFLCGRRSGRGVAACCGSYSRRACCWLSSAAPWHWFLLTWASRRWWHFIPRAFQTWQALRLSRWPCCLPGRSVSW
jgi:hypothetical protein